MVITNNLPLLCLTEICASEFSLLNILGAKSLLENLCMFHLSVHELNATLKFAKGSLHKRIISETRLWEGQF